MAIHIQRREFIVTLGGAAAAWPLAARAQPDGRMRRIGILMGTSESDPDQKGMVSTFARALADLGWTERISVSRGAGQRATSLGYGRMHWTSHA
jgi:3-hydroxy-3-methylglutaryl CoA synthase